MGVFRQRRVKICLLLVVAWIGFSNVAAHAQPQAFITAVKHPEGTFLYGDLVHTSIDVFNSSPKPINVKLVWQLYTASRAEVAKQEISVLCQPMKTTAIINPFMLTTNLNPGHYFTQVESFLIEGDRLHPISIHHGGKGFWLLDKQFKGDEMTKWQTSDKPLGRTLFQSQNVSLSSGRLTLNIPENTLNGAEIWTRERLSYGIYSARLKLPNAPGSITGFFLYEPPDYAHEIDIELYNQPNSQLMLTTYANGSRQNAVQRPLAFDPTADFHEYLIDYQPNGLSFYVDGQWQQTWVSGYSHEPMRLMLNLWYPQWLEGVAPLKTEKLYLEWIRYN